MRLSFRVDADADLPILQEIVEATQSLSPVFDSITRPVAIEAGVMKA